MKLSKRLLCALVLTAFVIVNTFAMPVFADFTDLKNTDKVYTAVSVLGNLGVINGYEDGSFKPENNVTRAEFTAMLLRTRGLGALGSTELENPPFPDVTTSDVSWAIGNIRTAQSMGIVNGYEDGTFKPNNNVLYEEAVKMIVCALGYENFGAAGNEWYTKYITTANTLGFLNGAGGQIGTAATRATIAQMLYNCLEVKLADNNEISERTVLENDLQLTKKTGFIASNADTSLSAPDTNLKADEIEIYAPKDSGSGYETLTYKVSNAEEYKDMLGTQITFYYKEDRNAGTRTVIMSSVKKSESLTVNAADLVSGECTSDIIAYYKDDKASSSTKLKIAPDSAVIYNGKLYGANANSSTYSTYFSEMGDNAIPTIGSIRLLDRDGDGTYDIIFVDSYTAMYVSVVTTSNYTVVDNYLRTSGKKIELNPNNSSYDVTILDANGKETTFSAIKKDSVICYKESSNAGATQKKTVVICGKTVSGTVKSVGSNKTIKIDSTSYKYSLQAPWVLKAADSSTTLVAPAMDDTGKFFLDIDGNIVAYDKNEVQSNQQYGYIMQAKKSSASLDDEKVRFSILTQSGSKSEYYAYNKTKVNGETFDNYDKLLAKLEETAKLSRDVEYAGDETVKHSADYPIEQVIKFSTTTNKGETVIDEIITVTNDTKIKTIDSQRTVKATELTFYTGNYTTDTENDLKVTYGSTNKSLKGNGSKSAYVSSSTIVFEVPFDRTATKNYKKSSISNFANGKTYYMDFCDMTGTGTARVILLYGGAAKSGEVESLSPVVLVREITSETNEQEGSTMTKIVGYDARNSKDVSYWVSPDSESVVSNLKEGDVVRLGEDSDGYYTVKEEFIVFSVDGTVVRSDVKTNDYDTTKTVKDWGGIYIDTRDTIKSESKSTYASPEYRAIWGSMYAKDDEQVRVSTELLGDTDDVSTEDHLYNIEVSKFNNAKFFEYDTSVANPQLAEITKDDGTKAADILNSLTTYNGTTAPDQVFIYQQNSTVKLVVIVR